MTHFGGGNSQWRIFAVAVFSLEMSSVQLVNRLISGENEIEQEKTNKNKKDGDFSPSEFFG